MRQIISIIEEIELINDIIDSAIPHGEMLEEHIVLIGIHWRSQLVNGCSLRE